MGLLNSSLQIGRSALLSYQSALQVVGNNISSAGSPDHTRLSPRLDPIQGQPINGDLQPGAGVALTQIQRNINEALETRLRLAIGAQTSALTQESSLTQVEALFDDLSGAGIGDRLSDFFSTFDELQNTPEDLAVRDLTITTGARLAESLRNLRSQLTEISEDIDGQIGAIARQADQIAREIGRLNEEITRAEAGRSGQATGLRDQRDALLRELSTLFDVTVREQSNGTVNVYVGSEALVQGSAVRGLVAVTGLDGESSQTTVRFADTNQQMEIRGGQLEGLILSRNRDTQIAALDELTAGIIAEVNRIHADGQGLSGFRTVTGTSDVLATDAALDDPTAGLAFPPQNGSFYVTIADDATGTPVSHRIDVDLDGTGTGTSLNSLVDGINTQVEGLTASITSDNKLEINADDGLSFTFGYDGQTPREDTSGVLSALGINTFFTGNDARSISVNEKLVEQPSLLAAASVFAPGDGTIAGGIAALDTVVLGRFGESSITSFYNAIAGNVAVSSGAARGNAEAASTVLASLTAQRESISGVNLDEEAIALVQYERAFQGAARFVSVVDDLISQLIALIR
jgi:flagellar hook-associated protein 1 FlgK